MKQIEKKILFSHSYFYKYDSKQWAIAEPYPPLMTITAAALMRENKYDVELFDSALKSDISSLRPQIKEYHPDYFVLFDDGFNYLTKMCLTTMRHSAFEMQKIAKEEGAIVITCSSDSTDHYEEYLKEGADYVIKGEGELTLLELIKTLDSGGTVEEVEGVYFKNGKTQFTGTRKVNSELDKLPQAAWDLIDIEDYREIWENNHSHFYLNIATTRGCPYKCNWCAKPIYGNRYNSRSPEQVVKEIEMHVRNHKVDHFWMCDDIFGLKPGWVQAFDKELKKKNLKINYKIQSRADLLLKEDNIDCLASSGLSEVWIGAESGSQSILDAMDKGTTLEQIETATKILKAQNISVAFFLQFGYLGETIQDIKKTIYLIKDLLPDKIGVSVSYPLPGTKFYDIVKKDLSTKYNWEDSDDLDMMFKNTYQSGFYKILHRYIHNIHRIETGRNSLKRISSNPSKLSYVDLRNIGRMAYQFPKAFLNRRKINTALKLENKFSANEQF